MEAPSDLERQGLAQEDVAEEEQLRPQSLVN